MALLQVLGTYAETVTYYRENERGVKKKVNIPWSWCDIIRALNEVFSSLVLMVLP